MKRNQKRHSILRAHTTERLLARKIRQEQGGGFKCSHCKHWVVINEYMGTANRNHCNLCLWSKHVDIKKGDRLAECQAGMKPIGLTFRIEDAINRGEIMLIHDCMGCDKISINRLAADDGEHLVMEVYAASCQMTANTRMLLQEQAIYVADESDQGVIHRQLFGVI